MRIVDQVYVGSSSSGPGSPDDVHPIRSGSPPLRPDAEVSRSSIATTMSSLAARIIEAFAAHAQGMHPGFADSNERCDHLEPDRSAQPVRHPQGEHGSETPRLYGNDPWGRKAPMQSTGVTLPVRPTSVLTRFWSGIRHERKVRLTVLSLRALDDRTLKDIGIHRSQIESVARHGDPYRG